MSEHVSEHPTPANAQLMSTDPLNQFRVRTGRDFTPSAVEIAMEIVWLQLAVVMAEEYPHPNVPLDKAQARLDLALMALKQASIYDAKTMRGDWVAVA